MIQFISATTKQNFEIIAKLAHTIWHEHYTPIIGKDQVAYMVDKYQTHEAMMLQSDQGFEYYLIQNKENPIGYLAILKEQNTLFLSKIYILKAFRGKGFGKSAMNFIEERAKALACNSIYLTVNKNNSNSIRAYQKVGYEIIGPLIKDIGNGFVMDDYKMVKPL